MIPAVSLLDNRRSLWHLSRETPQEVEVGLFLPLIAQPLEHLQGLVRLVAQLRPARCLVHHLTITAGMEEECRVEARKEREVKVTSVFETEAVIAASAAIGASKEMTLHSKAQR